MSKRKIKPSRTFKKEEMNKKAIIWAASIFAVVVIAVAVLLVLNP